jgi:hypothetical protein
VGIPRRAGVVVLLVLAGVLLGEARAAAAGPEQTAEHVVVVGVAGLQWSDVTIEDTPTLAALTRSGSAGTLSVRSAADVTCPADGWLTLGAGTYAAASERAGADPGAGCAGRLPPPVAATGPAVPTMPELRARNAGLRQAARPGALGGQLRCITAVGPGAALAAADPDGEVTHYRPALPDRPAGVLARCPAALVDLGSVAGRADQRRRTLRSFDRDLARVRRDLPLGTVLIVLGVAETQTVQPRLHVAVADGPTFERGWLRSASTRRLPYVQLVDVAPTVLAALGREVPDDLAGRPLAGGAPVRPVATTSTIASLADTDAQAVAQRMVVLDFFAGLGAVLLLVLGLIWWLLRRRRRGEPTAPRAARWLSVVALGLSAVPAASFVANLVPWWRTAWPLASLAGLVAVAASAMAAIAILVSRRSRAWPTRVRARLGAVAAMTLLVFVLDGLTGAALQLNSPLGYNPLVAGRFVGFGNIAFAVYAVAGVLLATVVAHGRRRAVALGGLAAVAVPVVVLDGSPAWGADFGGVLTLIPTFTVLGLLLARARITWARLALATAGGALAALAISWLDYLRPPGARSHFGRFAGSMMDGTALETVRRKLLASIDLLVTGPHTVLAAVLVLVGIGLLLRPPSALRRVYRTWPVTRTALLAVVALAGFGLATNDSGIAIPTVMALVVLPTVLALSVWAVAGDPWHGPPPATAAGAAGSRG